MTLLKTASAAPILKWAGGKRRLLKQYAPYFPPIEKINHYYEPFMGSAAVFLHLQPECATLSDRNARLIEVYQTVQQDVEGVIVALQPHKNESDYYYQIRAQEPETLTAVQRTARLIFLNKTCYNGLYRENRSGQFNVPFGRYHNPTICDEKRLRNVSYLLQDVELLAVDFDEVIADAQPGDFVYFDPPYVPLNKTSNFTDYDQHGFNDDAHRRLAEAVAQLTDDGVNVMLSNSSADLVYELYDNGRYTLHEISARRNINSKANLRGPVKELLILNY